MDLLHCQIHRVWSVDSCLNFSFCLSAPCPWSHSTHTSSANLLQRSDAGGEVGRLGKNCIPFESCWKCEIPTTGKNLVVSLPFAWSNFTRCHPLIFLAESPFGSPTCWVDVVNCKLHFPKARESFPENTNSTRSAAECLGLKKFYVARFRRCPGKERIDSYLVPIQSESILVATPPDICTKVVVVHSHPISD